MKMLLAYFSEILFRAARWILGISTETIFPGVRKVIMRVAGIIEYQIELPYKTAEDVARSVKRFLGKKNIPYDDVHGEIRLVRSRMDGCPCFFVAEDGAVSFYTATRFSGRLLSRWDGFIREMKRSLPPWV